MVGFVGRQRGQSIIEVESVKRLQRANLQNALTAFAGGGKASATKLQHGFNRVSVAATAADSVLAPIAYAGAEFYLTNDGASSIQVFGQGTDTIDGVATGTGNAMAAAKRGLFICHIAGQWQSIIGAKTS